MEKAMASIWEAGGLRAGEQSSASRLSEKLGAVGMGSVGRSVAESPSPTQAAPSPADQPWAARRPARKMVGAAEAEPAAKASIAKAQSPSVGFYRESGGEVLRGGEVAAVARALHKKKIALPGEREREQKKLFVHGSHARKAEPGDLESAPAWGVKKRIAAAAGCALLAACLVVQLALEQRSELASRLPWTRSALEAACVAAGCSVGRSKAVAEIELEGAQVQVDSTGRLEFSGVLRSKAGFESEAPKLWLAIEGADGSQIAAKVFEPAEWLGAKTIPARGEIEARMAMSPMGESSGFKAILVWGG
jgi:hypothetical protein